MQEMDMHTKQLFFPVGSLNVSFLESPIARQHQEIIVSRLWGIKLKPQKEYLRPYFQYYTEQCRAAFMSHGSSLLIRTHQHIIDIANCIQEGHSRSELMDFVQQRRWTIGPTSENAINASIDLTVRLVYMIDIGEFKNAYSGRNTLLWTRDPLKDFMREVFSETVSLENNGTKLERTFNVGNMIRIAGFQVKPTSNICNHLRFGDFNKTVEVFHHVSFLMAHRQKSTFPPGLVDETLATLSLLFPQGHKETEKWYKRQNGPEELDGELLQYGKVKKPIKEYRYWHDRLVILKTEFDESRPSTITQWWSDRRDVSQWYSLWLAIALTVFFGLVQSIEGALQVYKAYSS